MRTELKHANCCFLPLAQRRKSGKKSKLRKIVVTLLTMSLAFTSLSTVNQVSSSSWVTDSADSIKIENDYFIVDIAKGLHGLIQRFHIKPYNDTNIVPKIRWDYLGAHKALYADGTEQGESRQWLDSSKKSQTTEIVYETSDTIVIKSITQFIQSNSSYVNMRTVQYMAFYADRPYYLVSIQRTYGQDYNYLFNSDYSFFFDPEWSSNYSYLDQTGKIVEDVIPKYDLRMQDASRLQKYPWVYTWNATHNVGHGTILLSAIPTTTQIGAFVKAPGYFEYQLNFDTNAAKAGQTVYATFLSYVTSDYNDVDNFAGELHFDLETTETFLKTVQNNPRKHPDGHLRCHISTPNMIHMKPYAEYIQTYGYYQDRGWSLFSHYKNATGSYSIFNWTEVIISNYAWNGSHSLITYQNDFQSKIRLEITTEVWNDSDVYLQTWNFTTLDTINASQLYMRAYSNQEAIGITSYIRLSSDVIKLNSSDYYQPFVQDTGHIYQNLAGTNEILADGVHFYALDSTEQTYTSGQSFIMKLKVQRFHRLKSEGLGWFGVSDILPLHESRIARFNKLSWTKFPLSENRSFGIKHLWLNRIIVESAFDGDSLNFTVVGEIGNASIVEIYCGDKGTPVLFFVDGVENPINYNSSLRVLTVSVLQTGSAKIIAAWRRFSETSLNLNPESVKIGESFMMTANLIDTTSQEPIVDQTIRFFVGTTEISSAQTDSSGKATESYDANVNAGAHEITAVYNGTVEHTPSLATETLIVKPLNTTLTIDVPQATRGKPVKITANLQDEKGNIVEGIDISFFLLEETTWTMIGLNKTDSTGVAFIWYTPSTKGTFEVKAVFDGENNYIESTSESVNLAVGAGQTGIDYTFYIIRGTAIAAICAAIASTILVIRKRRRTRKKRLPTEKLTEKSGMRAFYQSLSKF